VTRRLKTLGLLFAIALLAAGCAAGQAFRQGDAAMRTGDLDQAVAAYRRAVQAAPDNASYRIALQRAMLAASRAHFDKARQFEDQDQLEAALGEYKQANEYDPTNRQAGAKVAALDRTIRERVEAARPPPAIQQLRERARAASAEPILNPASREPLNIRFNNASLRDILNFIGMATGINMTYDREVVDRPATVQLDGVTVEQALNQILSTNQLSYKVLSERSILVFPDTAPKHAQYDDQVVRTFYLSNADATEMTQILSTIIRLPGIAVQPAIAGNKTSNSITVRGTAPVVGILEKIIAQNDKPRAEIVVDVEILEVNRNRAKTYGLNLSEYALGGLFSPEVSPNVTAPATGTTGTATTTTNTGPSGLKSPPPFNLNSISRGVTTADFYLAVPTAIVKFLESDSQTRLIAKPQLRGAEGTKLALKLGDQIPVISTSYTPIAGGGAAVNPLSSYQYKDVGVNIDMTPRVTLEGDIILDLMVDNSSVGQDRSVAGQLVPSFGQRTVTTRLRLRDGESNLLAGLLREDERKSLSGFPGAIHVPILRQLFSANDNSIAQTDIVMLLTPHIVRTSEITIEDLKPLYIGSQQNLGLGGPPSLIAPQPAEAIAAAPPVAQAAPAPGAPSTAIANPIGPPALGQTTPAGTVTVPPGTSPVPGTVLVPPTTAAPPPNVATSTGENPAAPPAPAPAAAPPAAAQTPPPAAPPITSPGLGVAQVIITPPGTTFRVGQGPYNTTISITGAQRLSAITLTITYDPAILRVRNVQEGSFMRTGGVNVSFVQQVNGGRIDITLARAADSTGASGTGLLALILFDAIAPGNATLTISGAATGPGATAMGLQFRPVTISVQQ
jgi:general secretion pathway protein D